MDKQWHLFLEIKSTFGEYPVKIAEMTTKDLDYYINLVYKTVTGFDMTDSNFGGKKGSTVSKKLSNSIECCREIVPEKKSKLMCPTSLLSYF